MFGNYKNFGQYLRNPQFNDVAGFNAATDKLPLVEKRPVFLEGGIAVPSKRAIVPVGASGQASGNAVLGVVSDRYEIIQHKEALVPILAGIQELGLQFRGSFYSQKAEGGTVDAATSTTSQTVVTEGADGARVFGLVIFEDPRFKFEVLHDYGEPIKLGFRFGNSVDGSTKLFAMDFGINLICSNFNMWGHMNERISLKHLRSGQDGMKDFEDYVMAALKRAERIPGIVLKAYETELEGVQLERVLLGIEMPRRVIEDVTTNFPEFLVGVQKQQGTNLKTAYDAITNYYTNHFDGSLARAEWGLSQAQQLMRLDLSDLLEMAEKREQREDVARQKAESRKIAVKTK
jgi:hypothetical protein